MAASRATPALARNAAGAPVTGDQWQHDDQNAERAQREQAFRHEADADAGTQPEAAPRGAAQAQRKPVVGDGKAAEQRHVGDELVAAHHQPETAEQQQRGNIAAALAVEFPPGQAAEQKRERHEEAGGEPRRIVQRQRRREQPCAGGGDQVEKRRFLEERLVCKMRHHPAAALEQFVNDAERVAFVRFPRIMADQAGQDPGETKQRDQCGAARDHGGKRRVLFTAARRVAVIVGMRRR